MLDENSPENDFKVAKNNNKKLKKLLSKQTMYNSIIAKTHSIPEYSQYFYN